MKKVIPFLIFIILPFALSAQWYGDGTSAGTAYYGIINSSYPLPSDKQWNLDNYPLGVIYVGRSGAGENDLEVSTGGTLTIGVGITVKFTQLTSDLFITGSGQLTATGSSSSKVTFTKDANEHWGHISFQSMSGTPSASSFDHCIFEYGYSTGTGSEPTKAGGALQVDFNGVTVNNSIFRYNYATFGGAMMINSNRNTVVSNSYFLSNDTYECAGALLLYTSSTALIQNCIFEDNYSRGYSQASYSGGAIWSYSNSSKIINCTFVENNSDRSGDAIFSYSSANMRIINSILWGSSDQFSGSNNTSTIVTCAFEGAKPTYAANSILISDVASDHFINAGASNWTLKVISPCRDGGSTPDPTVPLDYAGNSRVRTYDIGAYEVQYNYWLTTAATTDWSTAGNWNGGSPGSSQNLVIPTGATRYPTGSSHTINSGYGLVLDPGAQLTMTSLTNNGNLKLRSDATNISSLITNSTGVSAILELYLSGGGSQGSYKWHYISIPTTTNVAVSTFTGVTFDVVGYNEPRVTTDVAQGWIGYDGWIYSTPAEDYDYDYDFTELTLDRGYEFWDNNNNTFTFSGTLNSQDRSPTVTFKSGGSSTVNGFNLIGNPFPSGLDWDYIITYGYPENTSKSLYFTRDNKWCTYINHVGVPSDVNGYIPPMQGFFTKTYVENHTIPLAAAARTHTMHSRYKGEEVVPLVRLSLAEDTITDETVVRFDESAKSELDNDFDAVKMVTSTDNLLIYSTLNGVKYIINGLPYPDTSAEIPIVVNLLLPGDHTITSTQLQGLDDWDVKLKDNSTGFIIDLKTNPLLSFSSDPGTLADRFVLIISNITTGDTNIEFKNDGQFNIYQTYNIINIQPLADFWDGKTGSLKIFSITGQIVGSENNIEFYKNSLIRVSAPQTKGLYVVEIKSGAQRYTGKIIIK